MAENAAARRDAPSFFERYRIMRAVKTVGSAAVNTVAMYDRVAMPVGDCGAVRNGYIKATGGTASSAKPGALSE
jgi:hypothetical protein